MIVKETRLDAGSNIRADRDPDRRPAGRGVMGKVFGIVERDNQEAVLARLEIRRQKQWRDVGLQPVIRLRRRAIVKIIHHVRNDDVELSS